MSSAAVRKSTPVAAIAVHIGVVLCLWALAGVFFVPSAFAMEYVKSASNTATGSVTSVSASLAAPGATAGNMLIAVVSANGRTNINTPAGWTQIIHVRGAMGKPSQAMYYKTATAGETTVTATVASTMTSLGLSVHEYSGVTTCYTSTASYPGNNGTNLLNGSVTTVGVNELIFAAFVSEASTSIDGPSWNDPTTEGFIERTDRATTSGNATYAAGDSLVNNPGAHTVNVLAGAAGDWLGQISRCRDTTAPTVVNVTSSLGNGTYPIGTSVPIQVTFSEIVDVSGSPVLAIATGSPATTAATYASGTGSRTLTFNYVVGSGNYSSDLDYASTGALTLNGGTIRDVSANNATLTLPSPGASGSLGANKAIVIDGVAPTVTNVTSSTGDGTYGVGQSVSIQVTFNDNVTVTTGTGTPQLALATGSPATTAVDYVGGSGGTTLTFTYVIATGNYSSDLDYASTGALALNGGTIKDINGNNATLTLPSPGAAGSLGANKAIVIDAAAPTVVVTSTAPATTNVSPIPFRATFNESVTGLLSGEISVTNGSVTSFTPVSGTVYDFQVTPSGQGAVTATVPANVAQDAGGNWNTVSNTLSRTYDTVQPSVTLTSAVTDPTDQSDILFTATFSEPVTGFTLASQVTVTNAAVSDYAAISTTEYTFDVYPSGDPNAPVTVTVLLGAGEAQDAAGNDNTSSNGGTPYSFVFDAHTPTVTVTSTAPATTNISPIPFTATFSEPVTGLLDSEIDVSNGILGDFTEVDSWTYTFNVTPSSDGAVSVTVPADVAEDTYGHLNLVSNTLIRTYDTTGPSVDITSAAAEPTRTSPIPFTATFDESVTGLLSTEIVVTNGSVTAFTPVSGTVYTFEVTPAGQGEVSAMIPSGAADDAVGNPNADSNTLTRTYDTAEPVLAQVTPVAAMTADATPDYAFSSTEAGTISYGGSCTSAMTAAIDGTTTITFSALAAGLHNDCSLVVTDAAGNASAALVADAFTVDLAAPSAVADLATSAPTSSSVTLTWTSPSDDYSASADMRYDLRYATTAIASDAAFTTASQAAGEPTPASAGTSQTMTVSGLAGDTTYYFALKTRDGVMNLSALSNVPSATTEPAPAGGGGAAAGGSATDLVLTMSAAPVAVPSDGGKVTFTYTLVNKGPQHVFDVAIHDDLGAAGCAPVTYVSGDIDLDGLLDTESRERWVFTCTKTVTASETHTAAASGYWNYGLGTSNPASASVLVGATLASVNAHFHVRPFPAVLHVGGGESTLEYHVGNLGETPITDIRFSGTHCVLSDVLAGDANGNGAIDTGEHWQYACTGSFTQPTALVIVFSGMAGDTPVTDTAQVSIPVGSEVPHANIHLHVYASPARLPLGGGTAYLTYQVSNDGNVPLTDVELSSGSESCKEPTYESGDEGGDGILGVAERWIYTCIEELTATEVDAASVHGHTGDRTVTDDALFVVPVSTTPPPQDDPTKEGPYDASAALAATPDIDTDLGLTAVVTPTACVQGVRYKLPSDGNGDTQSDSTVYYCGRDGAFHAFLNSRVYMSWYGNFQGIRVMDAASFAAVSQGAPVLYRPGARLVKLQSNSRTYAVSRGGLLRWVKNEADAAALYGAAWASQVDDIPDAFFGGYRRGVDVP